MQQRSVHHVPTEVASEARQRQQACIAAGSSSIADRPLHGICIISQNKETQFSSSGSIPAAAVASNAPVTKWSEWHVSASDGLVPWR